MFRGSEGREERSDVYRDGVGRNPTSEMCGFLTVVCELFHVDSAVTAARLCLQVRDSDPNDLKRDRVVHLIDDFRIAGENGARILTNFTSF